MARDFFVCLFGNGNRPICLFKKKSESAVKIHDLCIPNTDFGTYFFTFSKKKSMELLRMGLNTVQHVRETENTTLFFFFFILLKHTRGKGALYVRSKFRKNLQSLTEVWISG